MGRVACYIDGFTLYHALDALQKPNLEWLNLKALAETFRHGDDELAATYYSTAVHHHEPVKAPRHRRYIDALRAVGVTAAYCR